MKIDIASMLETWENKKILKSLKDMGVDSEFINFSKFVYDSKEDLLRKNLDLLCIRGIGSCYPIAQLFLEETLLQKIKVVDRNNQSRIQICEKGALFLLLSLEEEYSHLICILQLYH